MKCFEAFAAVPKRYGAIFVWFSTNMGHTHYFVKNEKAMIQYSDRSKAVRGSPTAPGDRRPPFITTHSDLIPKGALTQALAPPPGVNRPLMCFRRGKNLSDALVWARLPSASRPLLSTTPIVSQPSETLRYSGRSSTHCRATRDHSQIYSEILGLNRDTPGGILTRYPSDSYSSSMEELKDEDMPKHLTTGRLFVLRLLSCCSDGRSTSKLTDFVKATDVTDFPTKLQDTALQLLVRWKSLQKEDTEPVTGASGAAKAVTGSAATVTSSAA